MSHSPYWAMCRRHIIHLDMDAFCGFVEQRDDPALRGVPIAVSGPGSAGYGDCGELEARKFGAFCHGIDNRPTPVPGARLCATSL